MPRDSISRRVARAAATGGSKSYRSRTPYGWYAILLVVCLLGIGLIAFSRHELVSRSAASTTTTPTTAPAKVPPTVTDHWQVAMALDICGKVQNLPRSATMATGLATSGNGVVNIQPALAGKNASQFTGANANVGKFLGAEGVELTDTSIKVPSSVASLAGTYTNGDKCSGKPGTVATSIWATPTSTPVSVSKNVTQLPFANGEMFMVTFLPKGAKVPAPPGKALVQQFLRSNPSGSVTTTTTTSVPGGSTTSTTAGAGATTTTAGAGATTSTTSGTAPPTTTAGAGTTTTTAG